MLLVRRPRLRNNDISTVFLHYAKGSRRRRKGHLRWLHRLTPYAPLGVIVKIIVVTIATLMCFAGDTCAVEFLVQDDSKEVIQQTDRLSQQQSTAPAEQNQSISQKEQCITKTEWPIA